ncbi:sigma-70 family RNA polymerase sigma factor [Patescibacteria group bacterium]|nr:sigma-70 family RNA polymerase sigma factor [Patescibacteria group bacterium]
MSEKSDEEIVHLVQSGRTDFFGVLIERYEEKIRRYARKFLSNKEDTDDIIQTVFIKAYVNIQSFDIKRKFSSWLYRIAHNELVNHLRKRRFFSSFNFDVFLPHSIRLRDNETDREVNYQEMRTIIEKCLNRLEMKYREVIIFYYLEELSYQEIADILQLPISTIGVRLSRGREKLKTIYNKIYGQQP